MSRIFNSARVDLPPAQYLFLQNAGVDKNKINQVLDEGIDLDEFTDALQEFKLKGQGTVRLHPDDLIKAHKSGLGINRYATMSRDGLFDSEIFDLWDRGLKEIDKTFTSWTGRPMYDIENVGKAMKQGGATFDEVKDAAFQRREDFDKANLTDPKTYFNPIPLISYTAGRVAGLSHDQIKDMHRRGIDIGDAARLMGVDSGYHEPVRKINEGDIFDNNTVGDLAEVEEAHKSPLGVDGWTHLRRTGASPEEIRDVIKDAQTRFFKKAWEAGWEHEDYKDLDDDELIDWDTVRDYYHRRKKGFTHAQGLLSPDEWNQLTAVPPSKTEVDHTAHVKEMRDIAESLALSGRTVPSSTSACSPDETSCTKHSGHFDPNVFTSNPDGTMSAPSDGVKTVTFPDINENLELKNKLIDRLSEISFFKPQQLLNFYLNNGNFNSLTKYRKNNVRPKRRSRIKTVQQIQEQQQILEPTEFSPVSSLLQHVLESVDKPITGLNNNGKPVRLEDLQEGIFKVTSKRFNSSDRIIFNAGKYDNIGFSDPPEGETDADIMRRISPSYEGEPNDVRITPEELADRFEVTGGPGAFVDPTVTEAYDDPEISPSEMIDTWGMTDQPQSFDDEKPTSEKSHPKHTCWNCGGLSVHNDPDHPDHELLKAAGLHYGESPDDVCPVCDNTGEVCAQCQNMKPDPDLLDEKEVSKLPKEQQSRIKKMFEPCKACFKSSKLPFSYIFKNTDNVFDIQKELSAMEHAGSTDVGYQPESDITEELPEDPLAGEFDWETPEEKPEPKPYKPQIDFDEDNISGDDDGFDIFGGPEYTEESDRDKE